VDQTLEGWFSDPFSRHEARWFSSGRPTFLVRDGHVESHDDPPDEAPSAVSGQIAAVRKVAKLSNRFDTVGVNERSRCRDLPRWQIPA
jgi:hypothetical protein